LVYTKFDLHSSLVYPMFGLHSMLVNPIKFNPMKCSSNDTQTTCNTPPHFILSDSYNNHKYSTDKVFLFKNTLTALVIFLGGATLFT
jgi:hypothetical protein